jgi:hypothetical protein
MASSVHAQAQEANGIAGEVARSISSPSVTTGGSGDRIDHSDPAGVGELLCGGTLKRVLWFHSRLGGKEDQATHDARPKATRLWLEAVE